jgi:hypothetical protein
MEGRLRAFQALFGVAILALATCMFFLFLRPSPRYDRSGDVLHVKGLIVEDANGHDRVLIGAPIPSASGRTRKDNTVGMIVLGANGADRLALAAPAPEPQIEGVVGHRIGGETGLILDDDHGDERGGFGVLDNDGRVSLGLDYPHGSAQAIGIGVLPGEASISLHDTKTITRVSLLERNDASPILFGLDLKSPTAVDLTTLRINPYRVKHVAIKPSDGALNAAIDNAIR